LDCYFLATVGLITYGEEKLSEFLKALSFCSLHFLIN